MPPRAVLFDLDNTLIHRSLGHASYARRFVDDFRSQLEDRVDATEVEEVIVRQDCGGYLPVDSPYSSIKQAVVAGLVEELAWKVVPDRARVLEHWIEISPTCVVEMPGARAIIASLVQRGVAIGIVSNGAERTRKMSVAALGILEHIDILQSSERAGISKPDPCIFSQTARLLGVEPGQCWFVGDHPENDVAGAAAAGMRAIWLTGFHPWPSGRDLPKSRVNALLELIPLLQS
jgi:putative hydrolase of the HAD superfamily